MPKRAQLCRFAAQEALAVLTPEDVVDSHMRLITKQEAARRATLSLRSLDRRLADGTGPAVIRIGPRRVGIAESDFDAWLASRRLPAPSEPPEKAIGAATTSAPLNPRGRSAKGRASVGGVVPG
jgi:predicted DNA-binding transcriptional regulator AlpA